MCGAPLACDPPRMGVLLVSGGSVGPVGATGQRRDEVWPAGSADGRVAEVPGPAEPGPGDAGPGGRDAAGAGAGVDPAPVAARVEIAAGGHQVVVEAPESLHVVAATARELWMATDNDRLVRGYAPVGFAAETAAGPLPPDLTLPARLTEGTFADEHTSPRR